MPDHLRDAGVPASGSSPSSRTHHRPLAPGTDERNDLCTKWVRSGRHSKVPKRSICRAPSRATYILAPGEEDPSTFRCTECEGEQKDAPVVGLTLIKGLRREGLDYRDGTILDPRDGSTYNALMELSPDGQTLTIRGYLGIPILGQSEVLHRAPDKTPESGRDWSCSS